jgi:hypothetical protein
MWRWLSDYSPRFIAGTLFPTDALSVAGGVALAASRRQLRHHNRPVVSGSAAGAAVGRSIAGVALALRRHREVIRFGRFLRFLLRAAASS